MHIMNTNIIQGTQVLGVLGVHTHFCRFAFLQWYNPMPKYGSNWTKKDKVPWYQVLGTFRCMPRITIIQLLGNAVFWLNGFSHPNGVSATLSPCYIMMGKHLNYHHHVCTKFGAYVQTHEEHSNVLESCTVRAICLGPTGNDRGRHYFLSLHTGCSIVQHCWTELHIPADTIDRVSQLGSDQDMPCHLTFSDQYGVNIHSYEDDDDASQSDNSTYQPPSDSDDDDPSDQGRPDYMDNDNGSTSDHDEDNSSNTHLDVNVNNSSDDNEPSNQSENVSASAIDDEDLQTDVSDDGDHTHSTPECSLPISGQGAEVDDDLSTGVGHDPSITEASSTTISPSTDNSSSTGVGLNPPSVATGHIAPALVDSPTPISNEPTALADHLTPSDSSDNNAPPVLIHSTPPATPPQPR